MTNQYELPHPLDRTGQQETADAILASPKKFVIVSAPTGSGKSAWAAYASKFQRTMVLTETKSLQIHNYQGSYDFDVSLGRGNFECEITGGDAELCPATRCEMNCPYAHNRRKAIASPRLANNYSKYTLDWILNTRHETDILFLDECHLVPKIVMENSGLEIPFNHKFIRMERREFPNGSIPVAIREGQKALSDMMTNLKRHEPAPPDGDTPKTRDRLQWERLRTKLLTARGYMSDAENPNSWYYEGGDNLTIKPLTSRYNFQSMFNTAEKVVLMSATIGNAHTFASELGIERDYDYISIPGEFGPEDRPVYDLNCPRISYRSSDEDKDQQAKIIANTLDTLPPYYTGIIHVKSKRQAYELQSRLTNHSKQNWFCTIPREVTGTENQLAWWDANREPGLYLIHWSFWEGVDLGADNVSIIAKIPFGYLGDDYNRAKFEYSKNGYFQESAQYIEQAAGRVRRGHKSHYGPNAEKFVAIADSSYKRQGKRIAVESYLSDDFRKSIKEYNVIQSENQSIVYT